MPELPEVQTTVNGINSRTRGLLISDAWTDYNSSFYAESDTIKSPRFFITFRKSVVGAHILEARRRGKNILISLSNGKTIIIHMKMTGHIMHGTYRKLEKRDSQGESWRPADPHNRALNDPFNRFIHFVLSFSDGSHLVLSDMRKFAKVTLADTEGLHESEHLKHHGPEPLEYRFGVEELVAAMNKKPNGPIKSVLMDHTVISGIGNIYSDEVLWRTDTHPLERVKNIPRSRWPLILKAIRETLKKGIDFGGDSMSDYRNILGERGAFQEQHKAYRKTGSRCLKRGCTGTIERIVVGGRSAHFCSKHQKLLKVPR